MRNQIAVNKKQSHGKGLETRWAGGVLELRVQTWSRAGLSGRGPGREFHKNKKVKATKEGLVSILNSVSITEAKSIAPNRTLAGSKGA